MEHKFQEFDRKISIKPWKTMGYLIAFSRTMQIQRENSSNTIRKALEIFPCTILRQFRDFGKDVGMFIFNFPYNRRDFVKSMGTKVFFRRMGFAAYSRIF